MIPIIMPFNICSRKLHYDFLANSEEFQEEHQFWLYYLTWTRRKVT
jgi:hypothetical protein